MIKNKYLAIDILCVIKLLKTKDDELLELKLSRLIDIQDLEILFKDRWKNTSDDSGKKVKSLDYLKDFDLLINLDFDFKNGTWFEFVGFIEKTLNEKNALSTRVSNRNYKKPSTSKNAGKKMQEEMHKQNDATKRRYSLEEYSEENGQKQLDNFFDSKRK